MLRTKRRDQIRDAIANEVTPTRSKSSDDLLLQLGPKQYAKLQRGGTTTPAGQFYFEHTETTPKHLRHIGNRRAAREHRVLAEQRKSSCAATSGGRRLRLHASGKALLRRKAESILSQRTCHHKKGALYLHGPFFPGSSQTPSWPKSCRSARGSRMPSKSGS